MNTALFLILSWLLVFRVIPKSNPFQDIPIQPPSPDVIQRQLFTMPKMPSKLRLLLAIPILYKLLRSKALPSRESIISPSEERVLLLGASSGVGRDLAHAYAKRGARMYAYPTPNSQVTAEVTDAWLLARRNSCWKSSRNAWTLD